MPLAGQTPASAPDRWLDGAPDRDGARPPGRLQPRDLQHPGPGDAAQERRPRRPRPDRRRRLPRAADRATSPTAASTSKRTSLDWFKFHVVSAEISEPVLFKKNACTPEFEHDREEGRRGHLLRRPRHPALGLRREDAPPDRDQRSVPPLPRGLGRLPPARRVPGREVRAAPRRPPGFPRPRHLPGLPDAQRRHGRDARPGHLDGGLRQDDGRGRHRPRPRAVAQQSLPRPLPARQAHGLQLPLAPARRHRASSSRRWASSRPTTRAS
ncbi:MAG: hypothetical protein MZV64_49985 [Ignavibacteriales bacterium]|nr:hypothetical protein [Ignavibacteriales bacterium]